MRFASLILALAGCGPVLLGEEHGHEDAGSPARPPDIEVVVAVALSGCEGCFELRASGKGGKAPYTFEWDDGSRSAKRRVCPADGIDSVSVAAVDADGQRSVTRVTRLAFPDASCLPPPPLLCIKNPSFEGQPAFNDGDSSNFDAAPWKECTNPTMLNSPDIANDSIKQPIASLPSPTDGQTFLGLQDGEQVSQKLCAAIDVGSVTYLQLDARRLYIGAGVTPDTAFPHLEIWGGLAADCTQKQLLWASEPLPSSWKTYCVALHPLQYMDQITLRAGASDSLPTYLLVDNLVPVESCP
jgi:hypothetical protein